MVSSPMPAVSGDFGESFKVFVGESVIGGEFPHFGEDFLPRNGRFRVLAAGASAAGALGNIRRAEGGIQCGEPIGEPLPLLIDFGKLAENRIPLGFGSLPSRGERGERNVCRNGFRRIVDRCGFHCLILRCLFSPSHCNRCFATGEVYHKNERIATPF